MSAASFSASARVATPNASRYLQQLCKHFAHKIPDTVFDAATGRVPFSFGVCDLDAAAEPGALLLRIAASSGEDFERLQGVVAGHLVRFAFREELTVTWVPAA